MTGSADAGAIAYRGAGPAAAGRIARLQAAAFPVRWEERFLASIMHLPGTIAFLAADRRGEDLGYVLARAIAGEAEIISIGVREDARRRGVGAGLLARALAAAQAAGAASIHLEVSVLNAAAIALYEQAGFARAGVRRAYYGDGSDALVLERRLEPRDKIA